MSIPTEHQIIRAPDGMPLYVLVPYGEYMDSAEKPDEEVLFPQEVVDLIVAENMSVPRAWREHLGLTQAEVARRMGISQSGYAQMERRGLALRHVTRVRLAAALGIEPEQLRPVD